MKLLDIAVVDSHPLMAEAIISLINRTPGIQIVGTGKDANDVISVATRCRPRILITDINLSGDIYNAIKLATRVSRETRILVYTAAAGLAPAVRAMDAGAAGYALKIGGGTDLLSAIHFINKGGTYITEAFSPQGASLLRNKSLRRKAAEAMAINKREETIVRLLARDLTNDEISDALSISEQAVGHYMEHLLRKLGDRNRLEEKMSSNEYTNAEGRSSFIN